MSVDPYIVQIPEFIVDIKTGRPSNEFSQWLIYDNRFKHDLFQTLGSGGDVLENQELSSAFEVPALSDELEKVKKRVAELEQQISTLLSLVQEQKKTEHVFDSQSLPDYEFLIKRINDLEQVI